MNELIAAVETLDPAAVGGALLASAGILFAIALGGLLRYLMKAIGYSKMYRKAGVAGWKAFIPVFNIYNNYKISWNSKMFFLFEGLYLLLSATANSAASAVQLVSVAAGIAAVVIDVKQHVKMANLFGKGTGTGLALMFFPGITSLILGLGKSEFQAIEK